MCNISPTDPVMFVTAKDPPSKFSMSFISSAGRRLNKTLINDAGSTSLESWCFVVTTSKFHTNPHIQPLSDLVGFGTPGKKNWSRIGRRTLVVHEYHTVPIGVNPGCLPFPSPGTELNAVSAAA